MIEKLSIHRVINTISDGGNYIVDKVDDPAMKWIRTEFSVIFFIADASLGTSGLE